MLFLILDSKTELITSESFFRRSLCKVVVYNLLQSKVKIDIDFILDILFSVVAIGK